MRLNEIDRRARAGDDVSEVEGLYDLTTTLAMVEDKVTSSVDKRRAQEAEAELQATRDVKHYLTRRRNEVAGTDQRARQNQRQVSSI